MVIWITGLSGAGKSTLARALFDHLRTRRGGVVVLDGDQVREAFGNDLGYAEADRILQIRRLQRFAKILSDQDLTVITAAVYWDPDLSGWNRRNLKGYFEVYLESSLEVLRRRDPKGLYARAAAGDCRHVVGVDIPWKIPRRPDLLINTDRLAMPDEWARRVLAGAPGLADPSEERGK